MRNIESELHEALLDFAPGVHDLEEQALIIAAATEIYLEKEGIKVAKRNVNPEKIHEARMTDSLLSAMSRLAEWNHDEEYSYDTLDVSALSPEQIIHKATKIAPGFVKLAAPGWGQDMDILNADDLSVFLNPKIEGHEADDYEINDSQERHLPDLYKIPGQPYHWTDSHSR